MNLEWKIKSFSELLHWLMDKPLALAKTYSYKNTNLVWKIKSFSELLNWLFGDTCMYLIKPEAFFDRSLQAQQKEHSNRPFPNYLWPLFQSESWCSSFHMKISFHLRVNEN